MSFLKLTRRQALLMSGAAIAASALPAFAEQPKAGGTLNFVFRAESPTLVAINNTSGPAWTVGPKIFDALLEYEADLTPKPQLAKEWSISPDGLRYEFKLRSGVKWHDGKDFTSEDVAFSILHLKVAHPRGRSTFATVARVETPDPLTAVIVLSAPAPALISALAATETPIIPKHIFEGSDPAAVPADNQLVGTGPFVFGEYVRGSHIILERNPNYWDQPKPYLDRIIVRFIPDAAARSAAYEAGEVDVGEAGSVPLSDVDRLKSAPGLGVLVENFAYSGSQQQLVFNLDNQYLSNIDVRHAIAHAIDLNVIVNTIYYGYAKISPSPISVALPKFYDPAIHPYPFDQAKANGLLDAAGYPRKEGGIRFALRLTYNSTIDKRLTEYLRQALAAVGIDGQIESYDFATYVKKVYSDRAFDLAAETLSNGFDPTVGVQRGYWSKNFKVGLPFSNGSHYSNSEVDRLLEAAAIETDPQKRWQYFSDFQKIISNDLPMLNLASPAEVIVYNTKLKNFALGAEGIKRNFADTYFES